MIMPRSTNDARLIRLVEERARAYFGADFDVPAAWEPGGADFFSPSLIEADLMRRVLPPGEFRLWFRRFLPGAVKSEPAVLFQPATVTDRTDPQLVHLDGLNLSRAWCMQSIAAVLSTDDPARAALEIQRRVTQPRRSSMSPAATTPANTGWRRLPSICCRHPSMIKLGCRSGGNAVEDGPRHDAFPGAARFSSQTSSRTFSKNALRSGSEMPLNSTWRRKGASASSAP